MREILITFILIALLGIALGLPLLHQKIKRNHWYGFRFPSAFRSEEVWRDVNRYGAKGFLWTCGIFLLASVALYFVPGITLDGYSLTCLVIFLVGMTITIVQTVRYSRTLRG